MSKNMYQKRRERQETRNNSENENVLKKSVINWYPGHMAKTKRLIKEKYDLIDCVYEIIDSRCPYSSKISDFDDLIKNKPRILIMTKKDLCDIKETNKWVKYYESLNYKVIVLDLKKDSLNELITMTKKRLPNKKEIRVLIMGIPNVGKSTLINRLVNKKVANVANTPGVTRNLVWLKTNYDLLLLDSPGLLCPKLDSEKRSLVLASITSIKESILPIDDVFLFIIKFLYKYYPNILMNLYNVKEIDEEDLNELYITIGKKIGAIKNNEPDYEKIETRIINDIKSEKIKGITFDRYEETRNN